MKTLLSVLILLLVSDYGWQKVSNEGPEPRYINQLASTKSGLILYGGKNRTNKGFDDIWKWENSTWTQLESGPPKRWDHSYTYMSSSDQVFLFGGRTFLDDSDNSKRIELDDNWIYKNNEWELLEITSPEPRSSHALTLINDGDQVVLFGGRDSNQVFGDTWIFDGQQWKKLDVAGPQKRYGHSLAYDQTSQVVFLFGGFDGKNLLNDFWKFDGKKWVELKINLSPSPRMAHAMQFDQNGRGVLFGGWDNSVSGELWEWSNEEWTLQESEISPQARLSSAIGFDALNDEFILFGGSTGFNGEFLSETWKLKSK